MLFWYGVGWVWWPVGLTWLLRIAFWALIILAIHTLLTGITRKPDQAAPGGQRQPRDERRILDERLARGEIDAKEYQRLRDALDGGSGREAPGPGACDDSPASRGTAAGAPTPPPAAGTGERLRQG